MHLMKQTEENKYIFEEKYQKLASQNKSLESQLFIKNGEIREMQEQVDRAVLEAKEAGYEKVEKL